MIRFSARTILDAIAIISASHNKEFNPETHLVYPIVSEGTLTHANGKTQIRTLFGASNPVSSTSTITKVKSAVSIEFIVLRNGTPSALKHKNVGGSFPEHSAVDLKKTAVTMVVMEFKQIIHTIAKATFANPTGFIKLCLSQAQSSLVRVACNLLENCDTIVAIISAVADTVDVAKASQLGLLQKHLWNLLNTMTEVEYDRRFQEALQHVASQAGRGVQVVQAEKIEQTLIQVTPQTSSQSLPIRNIPSVWSFLDPKVYCKQLVFSVSSEGTSTCVNLTDFNDVQIRSHVSLIAQIDYDDKIKKFDKFLVTRYSSDEGTNEFGKFLVGKVVRVGDQKEIKVPHTVFTVTDEKSPESSQVS